jgi:hypothetical protein
MAQRTFREVWCDNNGFRMNTFGIRGVDEDRSPCEVGSHGGTLGTPLGSCDGESLYAGREMRRHHAWRNEAGRSGAANHHPLAMVR